MSKATEKALKYRIELLYGIQNKDGQINLNKFFNKFHFAVAHGKALEIKIPSNNAKKYSQYNESITQGAKEDKLREKYKNCIGNTMSIYSMVKNNLIHCSECGKKEFKDLHHAIECKVCGNVEFKSILILNQFNSDKVQLRSRNYYFAQRSKIIYDTLKQYLPPNVLKGYIERYSLRDYETEFIKINRMSYGSRVKHINRYNMKMLTTEWANTRQAETCGYGKHQKTKKFMEEMAEQDDIMS